MGRESEANVEAGESALVGFIKERNTKRKCAAKAADPSWTVILGGSSDRLGTALGSRPKSATKKADLKSNYWPSQAHHLVPHETLKKHPIKNWLKANGKIWGDTPYDVDHKKNGMWMPYASSLAEWNIGAQTQADRAANRQLMFTVMSLAQIQLHQSRHSKSNRYGIGEAPYHVRVNKYLRHVQEGMMSHEGKRPDGQPVCSDCHSGKKAGKFPPRSNVIGFVDKASLLLKGDIRAMRIFVSRIAAEFALAGGFD